MRIRPVNMEFLYGTSFLSESPEAYERLILDAMRGDATLFTRDDEVEAQWRICDPILEAWDAAPSRPCRRLPGRLAGARGGRRAAARGRAVARDLSAPLLRAGARCRSTTPSGASRTRRPSRIEAALRDLLKERHAENESYVPARVLNLVVICDRDWRGEIENRLERVGRYHPSRTILCCVQPGREGIDAWARMTADSEPKPGSFALVHEEVVIDIGPAAPGAPGHDRRPAGHHRPLDGRLGPARARRGRGRAAPPRPGGAAATPCEDARRPRGAGPLAGAVGARLRRRPGLAAQHAVARAHRRLVRPAALARRSWTAISAVTVRHRPGLDRRRAAAAGLAGHARWAGAPSAWWPAGGAMRGHASTRAPGRRAGAASPTSA